MIVELVQDQKGFPLVFHWEWSIWSLQSHAPFQAPNLGILSAPSFWGCPQKPVLGIRFLLFQRGVQTLNFRVRTSNPYHDSPGMEFPGPNVQFSPCCGWPMPLFTSLLAICFIRLQCVQCTRLILRNIQDNQRIVSRILQQPKGSKDRHRISKAIFRQKQAIVLWLQNMLWFMQYDFSETHSL